MKEGYWVIRTYQSGSVGEKIKYWVSGARPTRSERKIKSDIKKLEQNYSSAEKELARLLNGNFGKGDILLGLDYSDAGLKKLEKRAAERAGEEDGTENESDAIFKAAAHELNLLLRRVKREAAKRGAEVRHVSVTSDMDGETGERVRVHHHLVINREALELFADKWTLGAVDWEPLAAQEDYTPVANYLIRQVRYISDVKKYTSSRNLDRPKPKDRIAINNSELRAPKGAKLLYRNPYIPYMPQYMRYYIGEQNRKGVDKLGEGAKTKPGGRGANHADGVGAAAGGQIPGAKAAPPRTKRRRKAAGNGNQNEKGRR